jgi:hypothetical protein
MPEVAHRIKVPANRKITIEVPADVPEGEEIEVVVRSLNGHANQRDRIVAVLSRIAAESAEPEPTKEELDSRVRAERESWE